MSKSNAVVMLSGGLDSSLNLLIAAERGYKPCAVTIDYGQNAFQRELEATLKIVSREKVKHFIIDMHWISDFSPASITSMTSELISEKKAHSERIEDIWVPNRNGVFLNVGAAIAEGICAKYVVLGCNRDEAELFSDNSIAFLESANNMLKLSTRKPVKAISFTAELGKADILKMLVERSYGIGDIWSCYTEGSEGKMCGKCMSCKHILRSVRELYPEIGMKRYFDNF